MRTRYGGLSRHATERAHNSDRRIVLTIDVRHFLADVVNFALKPAHATLQLVALPPDSRKLLLLLTQLCVTLVLRIHPDRENRTAHQDRERDAPQMRRR